MSPKRLAFTMFGMRRFTGRRVVAAVANGGVGDTCRLDIYRVKGVVYTSDLPKRRAVLQAVGKRVDISLLDPRGGANATHPARRHRERQPNRHCIAADPA